MPKGSRVLMADDDKMLLDMYKERLELAGYMVQSYPNGEDALAHIRDFKPDIILLDVMMPKMNGYEALASIKSDPTTKDVPVIMLSALMRDFNREKAVEGGAEDYLIKSEAMPSDVITKIEQVLQKYGKGSTPVPGASSATQPRFNDQSKVIFEPAISPALPAVGDKNQINLKPEIGLPKMTEVPAIVTPVSKDPGKESVKPKRWFKPVIFLVLFILVIVILYFMTSKKIV